MCHVARLVEVGVGAGLRLHRCVDGAQVAGELGAKCQPRPHSGATAVRAGLIVSLPGRVSNSTWGWVGREMRLPGGRNCACLPTTPRAPQTHAAALGLHPKLTPQPLPPPACSGAHTPRTPSPGRPAPVREWVHSCTGLGRRRRLPGAAASARTCGGAGGGQHRRVAAGQGHPMLPQRQIRNSRGGCALDQTCVSAVG